MLRLSLVVAVLVLGASGSAWAGPILSGSVADARLCADPACDMVMMTLETERPAPGSVTGTLEINPTTVSIDFGPLEIDLPTFRVQFDLTLESAVLREADSVMTGLALNDVRFQGSATLSPGAGEAGSRPITSGAAQADGTAVGINPLADSVAISFSSTPELGGTCRVRSISPSDCAIVFKPFAIPFEGRYLTMTLNVTVPEPETLLLLAVGLVVVRCTRRWQCTG